MSAVSELRTFDRAEPLYLVEITLVGAGAPVLYFAEQSVTLDEISYEPYLAGIEGVKGGCSPFFGGPDMSIRILFLNEPWGIYSRLAEVGDDFPFEGAKLSLMEVYIGIDGEPAGPELLYRGVLGRLSSIDLMGFQAEVASPELRTYIT